MNRKLTKSQDKTLRGELKHVAEWTVIGHRSAIKFLCRAGLAQYPTWWSAELTDKGHQWITSRR